MAIIIDLFTKKVLAINPESIEESDIKPYSYYRALMEARFGDSLPKHFKRLMSKPQGQPYMCGDPHALKNRAKCPNFNKPFPVPCEITIDSCIRIDGVLTLGSKCEQGIDEPFAWLDHKWKSSLNFLKSLPSGTKLNIFTRSDLIAHDDYVKEIKRLDVFVTILFATKNPEQGRYDEPGAPSFKRRQEAVLKLKECNISATLQQTRLKIVA